MKIDFSISEFAKLADTTRDTLIHYDDLNLFKPARRNANGYRFYHAAQIAPFYRLKHYRELGFTLQEMQLLVADMGQSVKRKRVLQLQVDRLELEIKRMMQTRKNLDRQIYLNTLFEQLSVDEVSVVSFIPFSFIASKEVISERNFLNVLSTLKQETEDLHLYSDASIGFRYHKQTQQEELLMSVLADGTTASAYAVYFSFCAYDKVEELISTFIHETNSMHLDDEVFAFELQVTKDEQPLWIIYAKQA